MNSQRAPNPSNAELDCYLPGPKVEARYGVSSMTIWRWQRDTELKFPRPMQIAKHKYWLLSDLETWEKSQTFKSEPIAEAEASDG